MENLSAIRADIDAIDRDFSITTTFNNSALKTGSTCSFIPINSAIPPIFALSYFYSLHYAEVSDNQIIYLLRQRFKLTEKVGNIKAKHALPISDEQREQDQFRNYKNLLERKGSVIR